MAIWGDYSVPTEDPDSITGLPDVVQLPWPTVMMNENQCATAATATVVTLYPLLDKLSDILCYIVLPRSKPTRTVLNLLQAELKHPNAGVEKKDHEKWVVQLAELVGKPRSECAGVRHVFETDSFRDFLELFRR